MRILLRMRLNEIVIFNLLALACNSAPPRFHPPAPPLPQPSAVSPGQWFSGSIVTIEGRPSQGAIVILTDLDTKALFAITRTDSNGIFRVASKARNIALTVTSEDGVAYVPHINADHDDSRITLTTECSEFRGHIDIVERPPSEMIIHVSRIGNNIGDTFGAILGTEGNFRVCVPSGLYIVTFDKTLVSRYNITFVPGPSIEFRTATNAQIDQALPDEYDIVPEARESFSRNLSPDVRVIGLGESNHGSLEYSDERTEFAIELARNNKLSFIMIEAGFGETLLLDDYINGIRVDIRAAVTRLGYWPWDTETFLRSLEKLKKYNANIKPSRRIHLVGLDIQTTVGAVEFLIHTHRNLQSTQIKAPFMKFAEAKGKQWLTLDDDDKLVIRSELEKLAKIQSRSTPGLFSNPGKTVLAARSLLLRIELLEAKTPLQEEVSRDAGMARLALDVLEMHPSSRALLWAHLAHLSREYMIGAETLGHHLTTQFGEAYRVYALLAYSGSVRAWDSKSKLGVIPHRIPESLPGSVEATLNKRRRGSAITYWDFAHTPGAAGQWLRGIHRLCEFGAVYPGDRRVFPIWDLRSIDGAILFDNVQPSVPTATGVRVADPEAK